MAYSDCVAGPSWSGGALAPSRTMRPGRYGLLLRDARKSALLGRGDEPSVTQLVLFQSLDQHRAGISDPAGGVFGANAQAAMQVLRDDAVQGRDVDRGVPDHLFRREAGAGKAGRKDLNGVADRGFELRKLDAHAGIGAGGEMEMVGIVATVFEHRDAGRNQRRFALRLVSGRDPHAADELAPAARRRVRQQRLLVR